MRTASRRAGHGPWSSCEGRARPQGPRRTEARWGRRGRRARCGKPESVLKSRIILGHAEALDLTVSGERLPSEQVLADGSSAPSRPGLAWDLHPRQGECCGRGADGRRGPCLTALSCSVKRQCVEGDVSNDKRVSNM